MNRGACSTPLADGTAHRVMRCWMQLGALLLLVLAGLFGLGTAAAAPAPVPLSTLALDAGLRNQAWPAVTLQSDPSGVRTLDAARAAPEGFAAPGGAVSSLGVRPDAVWLHFRAQAPPADDGNWVLDVDYAPLNHVTVHVVLDGALVEQVALGSLQPRPTRWQGGRAHSALLSLAPGRTHDIYLRVQTATAMILPITLAKPTVFLQATLREQMLQGVLAGLALCLLIYSLGQAISLREPLFLQYALVVTGSTLFAWVQFGVGAQFLWPGSGWAELHMAGLASFTASCGSFLFIGRVLARPGRGRLFRRCMQAGAVLSAACGVAFAFDLLNSSQVVAAVSVLGLLPVLMGIPLAVRRWRQGEPAGAWLLVAWTVYFVATAIAVAVIKGHLPATGWTLHAFQFGSTLDLLIFMRVLGLRTRTLRLAAARATQERDAMHELANTDPLTGLPNRRALHEAFEARQADAGGGRAVLYLLDLDGFKPVNDRFGHDCGDSLLVAVARRLQATVRAGDLVARIGGDEFVVLAFGLPDPAVAGALGSDMVAALQVPFDIGRQRCQIGVTIGYALAPTDGLTVRALLQRADAALYQGKQAGRNRVVRASASVAG